MPSRPTLFDDDGEPRADLQDPIGDDSAAEAGAHPSRSSGRPNYLARRAIVVGAVVVVIAAVAVAVGALLSGGDDETGSGAASADWNRIVLVDERTGVVVVDDEAGEETARIQTGVLNITDTDTSGSRAVVTSTDATAVVDLDGEQSETYELGASTRGITMPSGSALTMVVQDPTGGRALLVHGPSGEVLDTDVDAPITGAQFEFDRAPSDPSGRNVLVTDSGNFQSVLLSFDRDDPSFFPGLALAVDADTAVTVQNVGNRATVSVFDHAGELATSAQTPSIRAAMLSGDVVLLVTADGQIVSMSAASGDTEDGEQLSIGTIQAGHVAPRGDRLVVVGSTGSAIVSDDGTVIGTYDGLLPSESGLDEIAPRRSDCLVLARTQPSEVVLVEFDDGATVAEAAAIGPTFATADGCTVLVATANGYDVISAASVTSATTDDQLVALSPDGQALIVERNNRSVLTEIADNTTAASPDHTTTDTTSDSTSDGSDDGSDSDIDLGPSQRRALFADL